MNDLLIYIVTVIVAFVGVLIGLKQDLWGLVDAGSVPFAVFAGGIFVLLLGDRIAAGVRATELKRSLGKSISETLAGVAQFNTIYEFQTSDNAMEYLCERLPLARKIWNTKVSKSGIEPHRRVATQYSAALRQSLKGGLVCRDVISQKFESSSKELAVLPDADGSYEYRVMISSPQCFLNFIVIEYRTGDEELLIGWATSPYLGTEQTAFKINDRRVIDYFKSYHSALFTE